MAQRIRPRADTSTNWASANPVLSLKEMGRDTTTGGIKFGNGSTAWNSLPYDIIGALGGQFRGAIQGRAPVALTDGATITPNFADSNDFTVTLGGNRTLANPTNIVAGQSGSIFITQDATGSRTLAFGTYFKFPSGTAPTLTTTASRVDRLDYVVKSTTEIHASLAKDVR